MYTGLFYISLAFTGLFCIYSLLYIGKERRQCVRERESGKKREKEKDRERKEKREWRQCV